MNKLELSGLKGEFEVKLYGPNGLLKDYRKVKNMTVTSGFTAVNYLMGDPSTRPNAFDYCGVGVGTTLGTHDSTLTFENARVLGGYTQSSSTVWTNNATFGAGTGTGAITESGLYNYSSLAVNTLLCKQTFAVINKGASDTLVVTWQYTLS